ncbi:hypothetical protein [Flavobacterium glaciei]|nr:hypothetical protein [Flavobacterium glaciei]
MKKTTNGQQSRPHIQAHLVAPTHGRPLRNQKSLNFANAPTLHYDR